MSSRTYSSLAKALAASDPHWERSFVCHMHDDHRASASVNIQKGVWYCYTCHARGTTTGIQYDERLDLEYINTLLGEQRVLAERTLDLYTKGPVHPYWLSRYTEEACRHFQLGFDPESGRPCYPLRTPEGELLGVVTRALGDDGPKYKYPSGVKAHELLWNYSYQDIDTVVLVEGASDVVAVWEAGQVAFGIFGSALSQRQVQLLRQVAPDRVVLGFDNDHAGKACTRLAAALLADFDVREFPWDRFDRFNDLAEIPRDELAAALQNLTH